VFFRSESLSVRGQEPHFVYVIMKIINIIYKHRCMPTNHEERVMGKYDSTKWVRERALKGW
jgi:hypothetical protein